jgi:hypothetical protein
MRNSSRSSIHTTHNPSFDVKDWQVDNFIPPLLSIFRPPVTPRNDPEHERTEFSEKVEKRELYLQGGWLA